MEADQTETETGAGPRAGQGNPGGQGHVNHRQDQQNTDTLPNLLGAHIHIIVG